MEKAARIGWGVKLDGESIKIVATALLQRNRRSTVCVHMSAGKQRMLCKCEKLE